MTHPIDSHPRLRDMGFTNYAAYTRSQHWKTMRQQYKAQNGWTCYVCGKTDRLQLHHITYDRLGNERMSDLVPLCTAHHKTVHRIAQRREASLSRAHILARENYLGRQQGKTTNTRTVRAKRRRGKRGHL